MALPRPQALTALAREGLLGVGVPRQHAGAGGDLADLLHAVARSARHSLEAAITMASQRLLIEVLLLGENGGLREYRLPSLLDGVISANCTASWPQTQPTPALASDTGRGWRITGHLPAVPNLGTDWFLASVPLAFDRHDSFALVLLRSDEDGVVRTDAPLPGLGHSHRAALELRGVYFREDEIISSDGAGLVTKVRPLALGLRCAIAAGACLAVTDRWQDEAEQRVHRSTAERFLAAAVTSVRQREADTVPWIALKRLLCAFAARQVSPTTPVEPAMRRTLAQLKNV